MIKALCKYLVLPAHMSNFERDYLTRINRVALWFFVAHLPVFTLLAFFNRTEPLMAIALTSIVLIGPFLAVRFLKSLRTVSVIMGITAMFMGALLVHFGQGPVQIEMHFYFFVLLALLAVFANPVVIIAATVTVALHHLALWFLLPASVFNYEAPVWVVAVHALFVILEAIGACFMARGFFDNVVELDQHVQERTEKLSVAISKLNSEIAEKERTQAELAKVHREFIDAARRAGMAEIATGVLHNIGNALNSVTVSASMMSSQLTDSKLPQLKNTLALIDDHDENLGDFLTNDDKGKLVPKFLRLLSHNLDADHESLQREVKCLTDSVDHIKAIISTQQSYATAGGLIEPLDINEVLDDAINLNAASYVKHGVSIIRNYGELPVVLVDKQRLLQIVINLVKNAKEALEEQLPGQKNITIATRVDDDRLIIEVADSGIGIMPEKLNRVFSHGFTTKANGHGFGLHSCANAATEMEGSLSVKSDGHMQGATFVLNLPLVVAALPVGV
jgi:signal transduction histidine kinase